MDIERLRADEVMWAMYEQGWRDTYASAVAALAAEPLPLPVDLRPVAVGSDRGQANPDSAAIVNQQPTVDSRPTATGPVRSQTRVNRNAWRRNVSARPSKSQEQSIASTTRILSDDDVTTQERNCRDWVNSLQKCEEHGPEDIICPDSDVDSFISMTSKEKEDALWQPLSAPCFQNFTTADIIEYNSAWTNIPVRTCCDHCVLKF
ncbi:uncharacterized protein LOC112684538 [Sipha flava]|uniref:Uncharacterized protein LOC112684538 n=1 Tax=Sipha flava TaxID=143950 RepID=A0A8B8FN35_9HEMI|nr:uncharacterized protein LOC112684538 [Sipha flava]